MSVGDVSSTQNMYACCGVWFSAACPSGGVWCRLMLVVHAGTHVQRSDQAEKEHMVLPDLAQDLAQVSHTQGHRHLCVSSHKHACKCYQPCSSFCKHASLHTLEQACLHVCVIKSKLADWTVVIWHACLSVWHLHTNSTNAILGSNWAQQL